MMHEHYALSTQEQQDAGMPSGSKWYSICALAEFDRTSLQGVVALVRLVNKRK